MEAFNYDVNYTSIGLIYIQTEEESPLSERTFYGFENPNELMFLPYAFFYIYPRPGDRYIQLSNESLNVEWIFTKNGIWEAALGFFDIDPPYDTSILANYNQNNEAILEGEEY